MTRNVMENFKRYLGILDTLYTCDMQVGLPWKDSTDQMEQTYRNVFSHNMGGGEVQGHGAAISVAGEGLLFCRQPPVSLCGTGNKHYCIFCKSMYLTMRSHHRYRIPTRMLSRCPEAIKDEFGGKIIHFIKA